MTLHRRIEETLIAMTMYSLYTIAMETRERGVELETDCLTACLHAVTMGTIGFKFESY